MFTPAWVAITVEQWELVMGTAGQVLGLPQEGLC